MSDLSQACPKSTLVSIVCAISIGCLNDAMHTESDAGIWLVVAVLLLGLRSKVQGTSHAVVHHAA